MHTHSHVLSCAGHPATLNLISSLANLQCANYSPAHTYTLCLEASAAQPKKSSNHPDKHLAIPAQWAFVFGSPSGWVSERAASSNLPSMPLATNSQAKTHHPTWRSTSRCRRDGLALLARPQDGLL
eukprot:1157588-Pelagomonas_calceolata.AAC.13